MYLQVYLSNGLVYLPVYNVLGDEKFHLAAFHIVRGDQLIVQGDDPATVRTLLKCLRKLVPAACARVLWCAEKYEDSYRCNFLGLRSDVKIPDYILEADLFVLIKFTRGIII